MTARKARDPRSGGVARPEKLERGWGLFLLVEGSVRVWRGSGWPE